MTTTDSPLHQFKEAEAAFARLEAELIQGRLQPDQFASWLQQTQIQDFQGRAWSLGPRNGDWQLWDGQAWASAQPASVLPRPTSISELRAYFHHSECVTSVAFSPDGGRGLSASRDQTICLWDLQTGAEIRRFETYQDLDAQATFTQAGDRILAAQAGSSLVLTSWDLESGDQLPTIALSLQTLSICLSADGRSALTGHDGTVRLWDLENGALAAELGGHAGIVTCLTFSPDGQQALSGSEDETVRLWDLAEKREIRRLVHPGTVQAVVFLPGGRQALSSGGPPRSIRLWDIENGSELVEFRDAWNIRALVASPDGREALSLGNIAEISIWDVESGREFGRLIGHQEMPMAAAIAANGRYALSGGYDNTVRLWSLPE